MQALYVFEGMNIWHLWLLREYLENELGPGEKSCPIRFQNPTDPIEKELNNETFDMY